MKKLLHLLTPILFFTGLMAQQDPHYNLYQFNQMIINPAYAGARDGLSTVLTTRQQWVGFDGAPKTTCASVHTPIMKKNIGVGLTLINDIMGPRNVISAYGNFSYILKLSNKSKLSFGINAGYNRYQFRFSEIRFKEGIEIPSELSTIQNRGTLDINSGLYYRNSNFFMGLSATHINSPNVYTYKEQTTGAKYVYKVRTHLFLTVGRSFIVNKNLVFAPTTLIKVVNDRYSMDFNANFFIMKKMWFGVFYRNGYGPGALMQYYVSNKFRVAYSYDTGLKDARRLGGSHEITLGYDFAGVTPKTKMINPRFL